MEIIYKTSDGKFIVEATQADLRKIKGDDSYVPAVGETVDPAAAWDKWLLIGSKKADIEEASDHLAWLAGQLP